MGSKKKSALTKLHNLVKNNKEIQFHLCTKSASYLCKIDDTFPNNPVFPFQ